MPTQTVFKKFLLLNGNPTELFDVEKFVNENNLNYINIRLQDSPIKEVCVNDFQIDDVIVVTKNIIKSFNKRFPGSENYMLSQNSMKLFTGLNTV